MLYVLSGGRLIDPANSIDGLRDVVVEDGVIAAVYEAGKGPDIGAEKIDVSGRWVVPGLVDVHVHLREPGYEYKETIETGSKAAVVGGFTSVACMANTNPVNDNAAVTKAIRDRAAEVGLARVYPIGAVSKGLKGQELAEIGEMHRAGIIAISDDGMPIMDGNLMRRALEYASMFALPVIVHEEDKLIAGDWSMNEGEVSLRLGLRGMPAAAEEAMIARDVALVEHAGGRLHVAHISTAGGVELIRAAKRKGLPVTAEGTPHHFTLTEKAVEGYNTNAKMNPPLRTEKDVQAIRAAIADGTIDMIATDHAPHHRDEKECEFDRALNGIIGLETAVGLAMMMADDVKMSPSRLIDAMSTQPARFLGVPGGNLYPGQAADIAVIDPEHVWRVDPNRMESKSRNTPFGGMELKGRPVMTIVGGRIVWTLEDGFRDAGA